MSLSAIVELLKLLAPVIVALAPEVETLIQQLISTLEGKAQKVVPNSTLDSQQAKLEADLAAAQK